MNIQEYRKEILRTRRDSDYYDLQLEFNYGLFGEAAEVTEIIKKNKFHGHEVDKKHMEEEVGDFSWYLFNKANLLEVDVKVSEFIDFGGDSGDKFMDSVCKLTLCNDRDAWKEKAEYTLSILLEIIKEYGLDHYNEILQRNIDKLSIRYPEKFTTECSIKRVDLE